MKNSKNAGFLLSIIAIAAVVAVVVYMFLIRPALDSIAESNAATESATAFNDTLTIQLTQYQADFAKLPETEAQIEAIQEEFAPQEDLAEIRRQMFALLAEEGLVVKTDTVVASVLSVPGALFLQPAAAAVGRTSYTDALTYKDLYATQFSLTFSGSMDSIVRAIARIQMNEDRYFLVSSFSATRQEDPADGTYNASLTIYVFTLLDPTGTIDPGTNSTNVDPVTGEKQPETPPGSALTTTAVAPVPSPSPSPSPSPGDDEESTG